MNNKEKQKEIINDRYELFEKEVEQPKIQMINNDQRYILDFYLMGSTFDDEQKYEIEKKIDLLTYDEAEKLIENLKNNQLDVLDKNGWKQSDFAKSNKSF